MEQVRALIRYGLVVGVILAGCSARRKGQARDEKAAPTPKVSRMVRPTQRPLPSAMDTRQHTPQRPTKPVFTVPPPDMLHNYARILYDNGLYDDALREAIRVSSFYPEYELAAEAQILIGRINYDHRNPKRRPLAALKAWETFLTSYPDRPEAAEILCLAACCHEETGGYEEAVLLFRQVTNVFPKSPLADDAAYWLAHSLAKAGRTGESVLELRHFSARYPKAWDDLFGSRRHLDDDVVELLARLHRDAGDLRTAVEVLGTVPRHEDELDRYWQLQLDRAGILQDEIEDLQGAVEAYRGILNTCDDPVWREIATAKLARCERDLERNNRR